MIAESKPKNREGAVLWSLKILLGTLIVVLLGLHLVVNHLVVPGGLLSWADVVAYYQIPLIPAVEIVFLLVVVVHALLGLRSIILDLKPGARLSAILDVTFVLVGLASIVYGIRLVTIIVSFGSTAP